MNFIQLVGNFRAEFFLRLGQSFLGNFRFAIGVGNEGS
jgi:hypothetical protein